VDKQSVIHPTTSQPPTLPTHRRCVGWKTAKPFPRVTSTCSDRFRVASGICSAPLGGSLLAVAPKGTKRACPSIRPCASLRVRSLHRHSRGTPRRAIPGPSRLSRHPCRSTPSTAIPLTLLKGAVGVACRSVQKKQIKPKSSRATRSPFPPGGRVELLRSSVGWKTAKPFPRVTSRLPRCSFLSGYSSSESFFVYPEIVVIKLGLKHFCVWDERGSCLD